MDDVLADIISGFIGVAVACILAVDLGAQVRLRHMSQKIDKILEKLGK